MAQLFAIQAKHALAKRLRLASAVCKPSCVSGFISQEKVARSSGKDVAAKLRLAQSKASAVPKPLIMDLLFI